MILGGLSHRRLAVQVVVRGWSPWYLQCLGSAWTVEMYSSIHDLPTSQEGTNLQQKHETETWLQARGKLDMSLIFPEYHDS